MAVFYVAENDGVGKDLAWSGGTTGLLYHNITGPDDLPGPIYYDEAQTAPVADGTYLVSAVSGITEIFSIEVVSGNVVSAGPVGGSGSGSGSGSKSGSGSGSGLGSGIVSIKLPSCAYVSEISQTDPQALVDSVKSELRKLKNNPMAFGTITNRIIYLIMNGQSAPRSFNTRFVKPVDTVRQIVNTAKADFEQQIPGDFVQIPPSTVILTNLYEYDTYNDLSSPGTLYYSSTSLQFGTKLYSDSEQQIPAVDGDYTSTTSGDITISGGTVTAFNPPAPVVP